MPFIHASAENFSDIHDQLYWDDIGLKIASTTDSDVDRALASRHRTVEDFMALISTTATPYVETMAQISYRMTRQRFGKTIQLFVPLYLSNKCHNICTYCGFSLNNPIRRITLTEEKLEEELAAIKTLGFGHVVLLTGEAPGTVGMKYFQQMLPKVKKILPHVSMEVQPLEQEDYSLLIKQGLDAVLVYQESYHKSVYAKHHQRGNKQNFTYRLNTPDRLGRAGIRKIGIGSLIGLAENWRADVAISAIHLSYLQNKYWQTRYSVSVPRLRPCEGGITPASEISDRQMVQLICAWRLCFPEVEISLSTRESASLRDNIIQLGITSMSAASSTRPGGYSHPEDNSLAQFDISDKRRVPEVISMIKKQGLEAVWKDKELSIA